MLASAIVRRAVLPLTPPSHRLFVRAWANDKIEDGEPELRQLHRIVPNGCRTAVDAGANRGLYARRLARLCQSVYAFEINPAVTLDLERAKLPAVKIIHMGLSNETRDVTLYIPLLDGTMALDGWASLQPGNCQGVEQHIELAGRVRPLDSYALEDVDFIKIDVEGHELEVLQGAQETLGKYRPRILAELRHRDAVIAFLSRFGYSETRATALGVRNSAPWIHVFDAR